MSDEYKYERGSRRDIPVLEEDRGLTTEEVTIATDEELEQFYEDNKDAIDLIGGLDMFETLLNLPDDQFEELKPSFIQLFQETLREPESQEEFKLLILSQKYTSESLKNDFNMVIEAISTIDFLSEVKKDFLKEIYILSVNVFI